MSELEDRLVRQIYGAGLPDPEREVPMARVIQGVERGWRFDLAWPALSLAVEVEGATWAQGRHTRARGFEEDCQKYNVAALYGWIVLRVTGPMIDSGRALEYVEWAIRDAQTPEQQTGFGVQVPGSVPDEKRNPEPEAEPMPGAGVKASAAYTEAALEAYGDQVASVLEAQARVLQAGQPAADFLRCAEQAADLLSSADPAELAEKIGRLETEQQLLGAKAGIDGARRFLKVYLEALTVAETSEGDENGDVRDD